MARRRHPLPAWLLGLFIGLALPAVAQVSDPPATLQPNAAAASPARRVRSPDTLQLEPIYGRVQQMPRFVGGDQRAMEQYIRRHLRVPPDFPEGTVQVAFTVQKDGTLTDFEITEKLYPTNDAEALRVARLLAFAPGQHEGRPVAVRLRITADFRESARPRRRKKQ